MQGGRRPSNNNTDQDNNANNEVLANERIRTYNSEDWGMLRVDASKINDLLCDCEGCKHYNNHNIIKQNALDVHEAFKSFEQDEIARERIIDGSYKELIKGKKQFKRYYEDEIGDINQKRLNGYK